MTTTSTVKKVSSVNIADDTDIIELFKARKNFYNIFSEDFIKQCIYDAVDECPFIDFTSPRRRKSIIVRPFRVTLKFKVDEFYKYAQTLEKDDPVYEKAVMHAELHDLQKIDTIRTDLISRFISSAFNDNLVTGIDDPIISKALEQIDLTKARLKNVLTTINIISNEQLIDVESKNNEFIFNFMLFM